MRPIAPFKFQPSSFTTARVRLNPSPDFEANLAWIGRDPGAMKIIRRRAFANIAAIRRAWPASDNVHLLITNIMDREFQTRRPDRILSHVFCRECHGNNVESVPRIEEVPMPSAFQFWDRCAACDLKRQREAHRRMVERSKPVEIHRSYSGRRAGDDDVDVALIMAIAIDEEETAMAAGVA